MFNKTKISILVLSLLFSISGYSTVSVNWTTFGAVEDTGGNIPVGSLAYLIWAGSDDLIDPLNDANPLVATGDDIIIGTNNVSVAGFLLPGTTAAMGENFGEGSDGFVGGLVYVRVFNSGAPISGTEYGESLFGTPLLDQDASLLRVPE